MISRSLYNLLWYPALPIALAAARSASSEDRSERLGRGGSIDLAGSPRIWIHAASVGEVEAIRPVAAGLLERHLHAALIITTMTTTGRDSAKSRIPNARAWRLAPLDSPRAVRAFLATINPDLVLIAETELWPNFFFESAAHGARIAIVNGRMSERSMHRYLLARGLFGAALGSTRLILAQSQDDARRYRELCPSADIIVTGNTKLEESAGSDESIRPELRKFMEGRRILVAGSTAPGEESIVLSAYRELCGRYPDLALVIAPRHIERTGEIERMMRAESIQYCKASALDGDVGDTGILVLDTMGELRGLYYRAAIAFIGGSLVPGRGGQSPAEAAVAAVPVLIGPHHENQTEIVMTLVKVGAARIVRAAGEIVRECAKFLDDESTRVTASLAAREASRQMAGGARRVVAEIEKLLGAR